MLEFYHDRLIPILRDKVRFPVFFQLQFRSDWLLVKNALSSQKRLIDSQQEYQPKQWREHEVPVLYTPINSIEILKQKRLTIVVQLFEKTKTKHDNFAYINVNLKDFTPVESTVS